ncbi:MAG: hypothetical protein RMM98_15345 [Acidobacteriota bacterium]|nr:hypothetical protein [Blastocatellia bacterium]MDW8240978.1 hypothetical protein [Acidobacteriota bacterium]
MTVLISTLSVNCYLMSEPTALTNPGKTAGAWPSGVIRYNPARGANNTLVSAPVL